MSTERTKLQDKCIECNVPCYFEQAPYAREFGHIYTVDGLRAFLAEKRCEFCQDILADFHVFNSRKDTK